MAEISRGARALLSGAAGYRLFGTLICASAGRAVLIEEYARVKSGERVLDIGCGTGTIVPFLPRVEYLGFDVSEQYIKAARTRYGDRGTFVCGRVGVQTVPHQSYYDVVLAIGILHHLEDAEADEMFRIARRALRPGGRLITFDGCYVDGQSRLARWFISKDRGQNVRSKEAYLASAARVFSQVAASVRHDLLRIPYTHIILECRNA
jgi:cyclopropane fatty-acyl-phospholipid synthase-like methyltransferase